jgi:hypothetical protein
MLKPHLSYWTQGYQKKPNKHILNWHKLSAFLCKKHYGEVHFVTDSDSFELFKDIKFDSITVLEELSNIPKEYVSVWSLGKIKVFSWLAGKGEPFLHIDYDVFLWKRLPEYIEKSEIFVQNKEALKDLKFTYYEVEKMLENCAFKNFSVKDLPDYGFNNGIFGGSNLSFIKSYCDSALEFVMHKDNKKFWTQEYTQGYHWKLAVLAEQWYLACQAKKEKKKITCLFERTQEGNLPYEKDCEFFGYTHIWGKKRDKKVIKDLQDVIDSIEIFDKG